MTCSFLIQVVFCKKKKKLWFIGVEVEQETSAPPPKKKSWIRPWKDVQQEMTVKRVDNEKLALVLSQRLRDSRWEVKDSSLEFVASLLQVNHG